MFKTWIKPDPFGREYPPVRPKATIGNHPSVQPDGMSTYSWVRTLPRLREANECLGKILHATGSGISFVAYKMTDGSGNVQVVEGTAVYPPLMGTICP